MVTRSKEGRQDVTLGTGCPGRQPIFKSLGESTVPRTRGTNMSPHIRTDHHPQQSEEEGAWTSLSEALGVSEGPRAALPQPGAGIC